MRTEEEIKTMVAATQHEIINGSPVINRKNVKGRELERDKLRVQLGVLQWVLTTAKPAEDKSAAATGATTTEKTPALEEADKEEAETHPPAEKDADKV